MNKYKYLGVVLDEVLDYTVISDCLAVGGGRALGAVNMRFKTMKNMGLLTYKKLFENCVMPVYIMVLEYGVYKPIHVFRVCKTEQCAFN